MADLTTLVLPENLKPSDGRFGCGPSKVRPEALAALAASGSSVMGTSHRQPGVKSLVHRVRDGLQTLFSTSGRLSGHPGQRRHDRVLGCRRTRPGAQQVSTPGLR